MAHQGQTHSELAKIEQIITKFFAKSLHIILESRCPFVSSRIFSDEQVLSSLSPPSSSVFRPMDKWFNLALRDCSAAPENIDLWRQSNLEPMIVDVILVKSPDDWDTSNEQIIERWVLQYESKKSRGNRDGSVGSKRYSSTSSHALYKKSILLLRSLYATVRLLPAYKLFRDLVSNAQIRFYNLCHRISSCVEPFTRREEADMQKFLFTPIETSCGRLCLSVLYSSSVVELSFEPSTPISPQFIQEYVGSPLAEPLKRYPSGLVSQSSPSSSSFGRRHSWTCDLYRASPSSTNLSPSPTYSEAHAKQYTHCLPQANLPCHLYDEACAAHMKNPSYDEYSPSPMFSPSPSQSPPSYVPDSHISKSFLRSESTPVSIHSLPNRQLMLPSPPTKATRLTVFSKKFTNSGPFQTASTMNKLFSLSKDEAGKMLVVKPSSHSSPSKSLSRSSSRLSFQDDYDDSEFSGPFVVDDDDIIDPCPRPGSLDQLPSRPHEPSEFFPVKKSQDAAVGALVCMLKKAAPLHQDISGTKVNTKTDQLTCSNLFSSGLSASRTTSDALEDLRGYREMKDLLLKHEKISQA